MNTINKLSLIKGIKNITHMKSINLSLVKTVIEISIINIPPSSL
jgi:hypothetical protein